MYTNNQYGAYLAPVAEPVDIEPVAMLCTSGFNGGKPEDYDYDDDIAL